ncbi:hypothetical protein GCM10009863_44270 [Streptomyces axinellae]|uniref:Uncharacterized protein n=1 Tax=Streptomyces axinellae TaxID=552788 RepID=A0ABN3QFR5_9ACTN
MPSGAWPHSCAGSPSARDPSAGSLAPPPGPRVPGADRAEFPGGEGRCRQGEDEVTQEERGTFGRLYYLLMVGLVMEETLGPDTEVPGSMLVEAMRSIAGT